MCILSDDSEKMKLNVKLKLNTMINNKTKWEILNAAIEAQELLTSVETEFEETENAIYKAQKFIEKIQNLITKA